MRKVQLSDFPYEANVSDETDINPRTGTSREYREWISGTDISDDPYQWDNYPTAVDPAKMDAPVGTGAFEGNTDSSDELLFFVRPIAFPEFRTFRADWHNDPNHNNLP